MNPHLNLHLIVLIFIYFFKKNILINFKYKGNETQYSKHSGMRGKGKKNWRKNEKKNKHTKTSHNSA